MFFQVRRGIFLNNLVVHNNCDYEAQLERNSQLSGRRLIPLPVFYVSFYFAHCMCLYIFSAAFCTAHCALDLARDHAP